MNTSGDGVLFCWKTKTVISESMKNVEALHSFETCKDICADVSERMPNMEASTRWVREHVENKKFLSSRDFCRITERSSGVWSLKGSVLLP